MTWTEVGLVVGAVIGTLVFLVVNDSVKKRKQEEVKRKERPE